MSTTGEREQKLNFFSDILIYVPESIFAVLSPYLSKFLLTIYIFRLSYWLSYLILRFILYFRIYIISFWALGCVPKCRCSFKNRDLGPPGPLEPELTINDRSPYIVDDNLMHGIIPLALGCLSHCRYAKSISHHLKRFLLRRPSNFNTMKSKPCQMNLVALLQTAWLFGFQCDIFLFFFSSN